MTKALLQQQKIYEEKIKDLEKSVNLLYFLLNDQNNKQNALNSEILSLLRSIRLDQTNSSPQKTPRKRLNESPENIEESNSPPRSEEETAEKKP